MDARPRPPASRRRDVGDVFDGATISVADASTVASFVAGRGKAGASLDIGWSPFAGPGVRTSLEAKGFNRHTFLCGQSGSGKTFSLGVVLERLLTETTLRMIVVDPNSDYDGLGGLRPRESFDRTRAEPMTDEEYAGVAARYEAAVRYLAAEHYQQPREFSDELTALFGPNSETALRLLDTGTCRLEFEQYRQQFVLPCAVRIARANSS